MKRILLALVLSLSFITPSYADIYGIMEPVVIYTAPDTAASVDAILCEDNNILINGDDGSRYVTANCATTPVHNQMWPVPSASVLGLSASLAGKFNVPTGSTSQYIRGDGSLATLPTGGSNTIQYPGAGGSNPSARALNTCFQISSSHDALFWYSVDVSAALAVGSGTVTITSYTNNTCTTGAQVVRDGTVGGLGVAATTSIQLDSSIPAGKWLKITTSSTGLGVTLSMRANQTELLLP